MEIGRKQGAILNQWTGTLNPILVNDCEAIEILGDDGQWINVKPSDS